MQPHREPVGRGHVENAIKDQVRRIERGDVALGNQGQPDPEFVAPERQPAVFQRAGQLAFQRAIHPIRVAADRLVPDEQSAEDRAHQRKGQEERTSQRDESETMKPSPMPRDRRWVPSPL
jgi:hypothetical protein